MVVSLYAPFFAAYWPYILTALIGIVFTEMIVGSMKQLKYKQTHKVDVDPFIDFESSSTARFESQNNRGEEKEHIPYPYQDECYSEEEMIDRSLAFYHAMNKRRSVRDFSSETVPLEVIQNIIHTAGR